MWLNVNLESMHPGGFLTGVLYLQATGASALLCACMFALVSILAVACSAGFCILLLLADHCFGGHICSCLLLFSFGCSADLLKSLLWSLILQI